jgi:hypothetical protein
LRPWPVGAEPLLQRSIRLVAQGGTQDLPAQLLGAQALQNLAAPGNADDPQEQHRCAPPQLVVDLLPERLPKAGLAGRPAQRAQRRHVQLLERLGYDVTLTPAAA